MQQMKKNKKNWFDSDWITDWLNHEPLTDSVTDYLRLRDFKFYSVFILIILFLFFYSFLIILNY